MAIPRSHCRCLARRLCAPVRPGPARAQAAGPARRGTSGAPRGRLRALRRSRFMDAPSNEKKEKLKGGLSPEFSPEGPIKDRPGCWQPLPGRGTCRG